MIVILVSLFDATLKGSLLILLVALINRLIGGRFDPRWRHLLWVVVLIRLLMPVGPSSSWSLFNLLTSQQLAPPMRTMAIAPAPPPAEREVIESRGRTYRGSQWLAASRWLVGIWLGGVLLLSMRTLIASARTHRAVSRALKTNRIECAGMDNIRIVECDAVKTPALHGLLRPVILLPPGLARSFSDAELRHVVLHELWHHRRLDVAVSVLLSAVQTLHWFNPLVWFAASRIKEERELACDELALSCLEEEERSGYGMTILKLLERFRAPAPIPALVGIVNQKQKMKRRLTMIASFRDRTRFSILLFVTVIAVGAIGLTDARAGQRRMMMKEMDPAALATMQRLEQRVSFELTNATLTELLNAVSNATGVVVTQAPEVATMEIQQARFTLKAENVPAHAVLMESLIPFRLAPRPAAEGVTIAEGGQRFKISEKPGEKEKVVVVTNGTHEEAADVVRVLEGEAPEGAVNERVFVKRMDGAHEFDANGKLHRELTMKLDENGVTSEGKLTIDITK